MKNSSIKTMSIYVAALVLIVGGGIYAVFLSFGSASTSQVAAAPKVEREMIIAVEEVINGESFGGEVRVKFNDPEELPDYPEDAFGVYVSHADQSVTLGTGSIEVEIDVEINNDEEPVIVANATYDGPEVSFSFTDDTIFYQDTTPQPDITREHIEAGEATFSRAITPGSAADMADGMIVRIWGHEVNGEIVADIVVYEMPQ